MEEIPLCEAVSAIRMKLQDSNCNAFLALVRAGLWEKDVCLSEYGKIGYDGILKLTQEQTVVGLVTAGFEHVKDVRVPQEHVLQFVGLTLQDEQRNASVNTFIAKAVEKMREADIYTLLVKGQGIAQCYERPLWRTSGDIDFFLSDTNYEKAKNYLLPLSSNNKPERIFSKELGMSILETFGTSDEGRADPWYVEIHGTLRTGLSTCLDREIDSVQREVFYGGSVRTWQNGKTQVFLPGVNEDVFFVFTHYIKHFYKEGGVSIRQLCDWCRLLWTYRDSLNHRVLESRIRKAGLMTEWKAFGALAVDYLGIPVEAMPLYSEDKKWGKKAERIVAFILKGGKWQRFKDTFRVGSIFPLNTLKFLPGIIVGVNWLKIKERMFKR